MESPSPVLDNNISATTTPKQASNRIPLPAPSIALHAPTNASTSCYVSDPHSQKSTINSTAINAPPTRRSANLHQTLLTKLRPLPFQYIYTFSHQKSSKSSGPESLTILAPSIPDIAAFYRAHNNFPFNSLTLKDSIHIFRSGVLPLWEDVENLSGGCWTLKVRRENDRALRVFEEVAIMVVGGELQAAIQTVEEEKGGQRDHILGVSYSPRLYWAHVSVWTKRGENERSVQLVQDTVLSRLSEDLRPSGESEYYYKRHCHHDGWEDAVKDVRAKVACGVAESGKVVEK